MYSFFEKVYKGGAAVLTYNMDVEARSVWLRTTPGTLAAAQPYICTEAGLFYGREHFSTARTHKESWLFFYTLSGAGLIEQGGEHLTLGEGEALLMDCRTPQSYCTAPGQARWHHYWVHFDGPGVKALAPLLSPDGRLTAVRVPARVVQEPLRTILDELPRETAQSVIHVSLAVHTLLAQAARCRLGTGQDSAASNRALIERSVEHIRRHYAEPLSVEDLLAETPVSRSYFMRLFRQYMGVTPYSYLLSYRITQAKELLVLTDLPVGEIARRVGFGSESNFSCRFSAMTGQSPLGYRKSAMAPAAGRET